MYGGFEHETPNIPLSEVCKIDTAKLFAKHENLLQKIKPSESKGKEGEKEKKEGIKKNQQSLYNMDRKFVLSNQAHIALQYVDELGQFIDAEPSHKSAKCKNTVISSVRLHCLIPLPILGVCHGTKFPDDKPSPSQAHSLLLEKDWTR